jgi:hypothetical protein
MEILTHLAAYALGFVTPLALTWGTTRLAERMGMILTAFTIGDIRFERTEKQLQDDDRPTN